MPVAHTQRRVIGLRAFVKGVTHFASLWSNGIILISINFRVMIKVRLRKTEIKIFNVYNTTFVYGTYQFCLKRVNCKK